MILTSVGAPKVFSVIYLLRKNTNFPKKIHHSHTEIQGNRIKIALSLGYGCTRLFFKGRRSPVVGRCKHKLSDILIIALASYLCGGEDYESMHELCLEQGNSLGPLVELPNGCLSVDIFERVLQHIEPQSLYSCLQIYGKELISDLEGKHIAIDDKRMKGSKKKTGSTHILSAWVDEVGLSFAQETIAEKRNELQAIPEVLDSLDLSGAIISIDAMGTQIIIAEQIIQSEGDYILSLKGNQKHLVDSFV